MKQQRSRSALGPRPACWAGCVPGRVGGRWPAGSRWPAGASLPPCLAWLPAGSVLRRLLPVLHLKIPHLYSVEGKRVAAF